MDFESKIAPLVIRNNNQRHSDDDDIVQVKDKSSEVNNKTNNNNNVDAIANPTGCVMIPKVIDIKNCYEFIGLSQRVESEEEVDKNSDNDNQSEEKSDPKEETFTLPPIPPTIIKFVNRKKKEKVKRKEMRNIKINVKKHLRQQKLKVQRSEYQVLKTSRVELRDLLPEPEKISTKLSDIGQLLDSARSYSLQLQSDQERLEWELYTLERSNMILKRRLETLQRDSCWPFTVQVTSDKIVIERPVDRFIF